MGKKWQAVAWSRELPKPYRNGVFYRIGHHIAVILAGHAHTNGTGITVSTKTIAEESWCTVKEVEEALKWLEEEKWFTRQQGPKGVEWACNFEIARNGNSEVEERLERKLAAQRARQQRYIEKKKEALIGGVVNMRQSASVDGVSEGQVLTQPTDALTHVADAADAPSSRSSVSTRVITAVHSPASPLKSHEDPKEDPTTYAVPASGEPEQAAMFSTHQPPPGPRSLDYSGEFETFWAAWRAHNPKDVSGTARRPASNKGKAAKAFDSALKKTDLATINAAVPLYMATADPQRGFCQDASTWLNNRGWDDDFVPYRRPAQANSFTPQSFDHTDYHDTGGFGA